MLRCELKRTLFARIDAAMAKIQAMDDGFGNWAAFGDKILAEEDD